MSHLKSHQDHWTLSLCRLCVNLEIPHLLQHLWHWGSRMRGWELRNSCLIELFLFLEAQFNYTVFDLPYFKFVSLLIGFFRYACMKSLNGLLKVLIKYSEISFTVIWMLCRAEVEGVSGIDQQNSIFFFFYKDFAQSVYRCLCSCTVAGTDLQRAWEQVFEP